MLKQEQVVLKISISLDGRIKFIFFYVYIFVEHAHKSRAAEDERKERKEDLIEGKKKIINRDKF